MAIEISLRERQRPLVTSCNSEHPRIQFSMISKVGRAPRVGVVGCGYWGSKHVRVLSRLGSVGEVALIDPNPLSREAMLSAFPSARAFPDLESSLSHVDAVVIAVPARKHAELALKALRNGKHVLVEKPLATSLAEARLVVDEACRSNTILMVGHTFEFNPAVRELRRRLEQGELGEIYYIHSARLNLGPYRSDVNVVWDLAPHDISILNYVLRSTPTTVTAWGASHASTGLEDLAYARLEYEERRVTSYIHISWLDPIKVRRVTVVGSQKMAVYNDLHEERLRIFDRGVEGLSHDLHSFERPLSYRYGDIISPHIPLEEPLSLEDRHFVDCIRSGTAPETDGRDGLSVVGILEAMDRSLQAGAPVKVEYPLGFDGVSQAHTTGSRSRTHYDECPLP
jgi:predicted dehydrogenase